MIPLGAAFAHNGIFTLGEVLFTFGTVRLSLRVRHCFDLTIWSLGKDFRKRSRNWTSRMLREKTGFWALGTCFFQNFRPKTRFSLLDGTGNDSGRAPFKRMPRFGESIIKRIKRIIRRIENKVNNKFQ